MRVLSFFIMVGLSASCLKPSVNNRENVTLEFYPGTPTKAEISIGNYFSKLNIMLFDEDGNRAFDKVKTQTADENGYGTLSLALQEGTYTVVAIGHSSRVSATIKSPTVAQFTASNGEKLTDTFCYCGQIIVGKEKTTHTLVMGRVAAMFRLWLTDDTPSIVKAFRFDYTGGSANFNPSTGQGITKSSQSETRPTSGSGVYQVFTFPYLAASGVLKVTVTALDSNGSSVRQRNFTDVPVTVNMITTYTGPFFEEGDGETTQSDFGFSVNGDWDGEQTFTF